MAEHAPVVIVGSGIMGSVTAAQLRRRGYAGPLVMIEAAPAGDHVGRHLQSLAEGSVREAYTAHAAAGTQSMYVGAASHGAIDTSLAETPAGLYSLTAFGNAQDEFPAAAQGWNVGGMGIHWTAACPSPWGSEVPDLMAGRWDDELAEARDHLAVTTTAFGPTDAGAVVLERLATAFERRWAPGRGPQTMPMAATADAAGRRHRTAPGTIFPPLAGAPDDAFALRDGLIARAVRFTADGVEAVACHDVRTGEDVEIVASAVIVCADPLRTPQLLWASGIRHDAVGANLNEHAFVAGRVLTPRAELGDARIAALDEGEWMTDSLWVPHSDALQPDHWQVSVAPLYTEDLREPAGVSVGVSVYVPTETLPENRIRFSDDDVDAAGLPRMTIRYRYSDEDERRIAAAIRRQSAVMAVVGGPDGVPEQLRLAPGSSLHLSGTARMSAADDGSGVCDERCQVWGVPGLYVAGSAALPTPIVGNVTLAASVTAVRVARAVVARLR